jgi:hypothetical protein
VAVLQCIGKLLDVCGSPPLIKPNTALQLLCVVDDQTSVVRIENVKDNGHSLLCQAKIENQIINDAMQSQCEITDKF